MSSAPLHAPFGELAIPRRERSERRIVLVQGQLQFAACLLDTMGETRGPAARARRVARGRALCDVVVTRRTPDRSPHIDDPTRARLPRLLREIET